MVSRILIVIVPVILASVTFLLYKKRRGQVSDSRDYNRITLESLIKEFKGEVADLTKEDSSILVSDINYEIIARERKKIIDAIPAAAQGIPWAYGVVEGLARNFVEKKFKTKEELLNVVDFDSYTTLGSMWQWEILLYKLSKKHGKKVVRYLEDTYEITKQHVKTYTERVSGNRTFKRDYTIREFDAGMLMYIFDKEVVAERYADGSILTFEECIDLLADNITAYFSGLELIASLERQSIDGFHFGASGSIRYQLDGKYDVPYRVTNSLWVQIDAKWVLFSFIEFKTVEKMRKLVTQLTSYGETAPITESKPWKVTEGYDGSRRVGIRPSAGECWFYTQRNFTLPVYSMKELLDKSYARNWWLPAQLIGFLVKAEETTAFTGPQNVGKTSIMKAAAGNIVDKNIRVLEMSFELALRELYPWLDVMTVKPTDYVSSEQLQDLLKKTDAWVSMVGEVAENIVAARMIQFCLIASAFTMFSHHGIDDFDLINGLAQSLVSCGEYKDHEIALNTVLDAVKNNVHSDFVSLGEGENKLRVIAYISQIIKEDEVQSYPEIDELLSRARRALKTKDANSLTEAMVAYMVLTREYYTRTTDRVHMTSRKIIVYDPQLRAYVPNEWYTPTQMERMCSNMDDETRQEFIRFYIDNWVEHKCMEGLAENGN